MAPTSSKTYRALKPLAPALDVSSNSEICTDYVQGLCQNTTCTPAKHKLCRIREDHTGAGLNTLIARNTLLRVGHEKEFENDGPGTVSLQGPRHDNDHVDIPNIKILPTVDEILSVRMAYMPRKAKSAFHPHSSNAVKRYMDTQFRQLRYDCIASVIDACLSGFRLATKASHPKPEFRQETSKGTKYYWFEDVRLEMCLFNDQNGAMFQLSYDCPTAFQGPRKMLNAPFFREGMLCALLVVHEETSELNIVFLQVHRSQSTDAMRSRTGSHQRAAVQLVLADPDDADKVAELAYYHRGQMVGKKFLVDMPSILVASFLSHLKILQDLFADGNFAFKEYLTTDDPTASMRTEQGVYMPAPNDICKDRQFNLNCLKRDPMDKADLMVTALPLNLHPNKDYELLSIKQRSILDDGQAVALFDSLTRELAFTQGPPGTGKTFLGVALVETIIKSRDPSQKQPPIVVVCQTNHALDDFLDELIKRGFTKISRIGGGSTVKWIGPYLLRNQTSKRKLSCREVSSAGRLKHRIESLHRLGSTFAEALNERTVVSWTLIESHMGERHEEIYKHFTALDVGSNQMATQDLRSVKMRHGFAFMYWQEGGDIRDANGLINAFDNMLGESQLLKQWSVFEVALLKEEVAQGFRAGVEMVVMDGGCCHLWALDAESRKQLALRWLDEANPKAMCEAFGELHRRFRRVKRHCRAQRFEQDVATLLDLGVEVVGMTSTACATMHPLLQKIAPEVMIFEEASELIEVHSMIALVSSVRHCIQIGDPLQLRPHVEQRKLSVENSSIYCLDESLFERFMKAGVPFAQLNTQRRAHPHIADLLRVGDYPYLVDHATTLSRPPVTGMNARLWWFDHKNPEDCIDQLSALSKSAANQYEVKFVTALVRYLVEKQHYKFHEITVLTAYKGQLAALQKDLSQICSVSLTEGDRNELIEAALIEDKEVVDGTTLDVALSDMLRIATIDNYQGEQARVIIFSAVRSNSKNLLGFLANHNRTNVAISRAEDGFFVIGNATLMEQSDHWAKIIQSFRAKGAIGRTLIAQCHQHPQKTWTITSPADFQYAACIERCNEELPCGHICKSPCHLQEMHHDGRLPCSEPCSKVRSCGHGCVRLCGQRCGPCTAPTECVTLSCGHPATLTCGEKLENLFCTVALDSVQLECGHLQSILCSKPLGQSPLRCSEVCAIMLPCGHQCPAKCSDCQDSKEHTQACKVPCNRTLRCGHTCEESCHAMECPPCQKPCKKKCEHGQCKHVCSQPCKVCVSPVIDEACPHMESSSTTKICCLPSILIPCSIPCGKTLSCGLHICPSLCGEECPQECNQCVRGTNESEPIIALACGHMFPVQELDKAYGIPSNYTYGSNTNISGIALKRILPAEDLRCMECTALIGTTRRYALTKALPSLPDTMDRLIVFCAKRLLQSHREVSMGERILFGRAQDFFSNLKSGPMSVTTNQHAITERCRRLIDAQQRATQNARTHILQIEESIQALCAALNNQEMFPIPILGFSLRFELLYFQSRLAMIDFAHRIAAHFAKSPSSDLQSRLLVKGYTAHAIEQAAGECMAIQDRITECEAKNFKRLEVELRIVQLCYWTILKVHKFPSKVDLDVSACLARIQHLINCYPNTAGLFWTGFNSLRTSIVENRLPPRFFSLCSEKTDDLWRRLGDYKTGELLQCHYNHVYLRTVCHQGCPECGLEIHHVGPESYDQKNVIAQWKGSLDPIDVNAFVDQVQAMTFTVRT